MAYTTKEEILKLAEIDPEFEAFLKANPPPPVDYNDIAMFKEVSKGRLAMIEKVLGPLPPTIKASEVSYTARDGHTNRAKLFQPSTPPADGSPLVVLIHGGGFTVGFPEGEEQTARNLVASFGATAVSVAYRLAPEFPFPYAVNDCWDALRWAAGQASAWGADPSKGFIVGGTSAGGNISAVLAHKARDDVNFSPPLTGQYLAIPAVCPPSQLPEKYKEWYLSHEQNKNAPVLPQSAIDMFMKAYAPDESDSENYSVFNHPKGHKDLPPAYFQVDGLDPLRDEALIYERVLRDEYGIKTKLDVYPGLPHGHWGFFPMLKASKKFRVDQVNGLGWLLGRKPNVEASQTDAKPAAV